MAFTEALMEVLKLVVPPKAEDVDGQTRWRWVVFAGLTLIGGALSLHISLAAGVFPSVFSGYALQSDEAHIQRRLDMIATLDLEHGMREKMSELCVEHDPGRRVEINDEISRLQRQYWEVNHEYYVIPGCSQL